MERAKQNREMPTFIRCPRMSSFGVLKSTSFTNQEKYGRNISFLVLSPGLFKFFRYSVHLLKTLKGGNHDEKIFDSFSPSLSLPQFGASLSGDSGGSKH